jgi:hypothetical protein
MSSPLDRKEHDVGVVFVAPASTTDKRVPTAEEMTLRELIRLHNEKQRFAPQWKSEPQFDIAASPRTATVSGRFRVPTCPREMTLAGVEFTVPALPNTTSVVSRIDRLYLIGLVAEVGADQDSVLGEFSFRYRQTDAVTGDVTITTISAENTRRFRSFWLLAHVEGATLTPADVVNLLTLDETTGDRFLTIPDATATGWAIGIDGVRLYAKDPNWVAGKTYKIYPTLIDVLEAGHVRRQQNHANRGFIWGYNGESALTPEDFSFDREFLDSPLTRRMEQRVFELFSGRPACGKYWQKAVMNLTGGSIGGNPGHPGEAAVSPNGSVCLANDQRTSFTNQRRVHHLAVARTTTSNNGAGRAVATFSVNTNAPLNTTFSADARDHKIYTLEGVELSEQGTFQGLGSGGTLLWTADAVGTPPHGSVVVFQPGIANPAGSGFAIPFEECEAVWRNGAPINSANIRPAHTGDVGAYEAPANGEEYIVILGKERAALHYVYRKIQVQTNGNGAAIVPSTERACFAFIEGVNGRIDKPAHLGLTPNQPYNALVYYPPRSAESWQFRFKYCQYQGLTDENLVQNATVTSLAKAYAHTQGGGASAFFGDERIKYSAIAMHLPTSEAPDAILTQDLDTPVVFPGEFFKKPPCFREVIAIDGDEAISPDVGLSVLYNIAAQGATRGLSGELRTENNILFGFSSGALSNQAPYQIVHCFGISKGDLNYAVVSTKTLVTDSARLSTNEQTAFDVFKV